MSDLKTMYFLGRKVEIDHGVRQDKDARWVWAPEKEEWYWVHQLRASPWGE